MIAPRRHPFELISRVLATRLRGAPACPDLRAALRSRRVDWRRVIGRASAEYVLPAFAAALRDLDLIHLPDEEAGAFLEAVHAANGERNRALREELAQAVGVLNAAGIEPVLIKGAIRLVDRLYPDDGWRMLRDLDLLVPKRALADAIQALANAGYAACGSSQVVRHRTGMCQIDLHSELFCTPAQVRLLPAPEIFERARPLAVGDGRARIPAVEEQIVHLVGHSQIRHFGHAFGRVALCNRLEAAALAQWTAVGVDWPSVLERFAKVGYRRPLLSFLLAMADGDWCAAPAPGRIDMLSALDRRRVALQARSTALAYIGARVGWWISAVGLQMERDDDGRRKAIVNLERLLAEPGTVARLFRAFIGQKRHVLHVLPFLSWLALS